jgi:hypothetical protein
MKIVINPRALECYESILFDSWWLTGKSLFIVLIALCVLKVISHAKDVNHGHK